MTTHEPARSRNTDTAKARIASRASYARRRHGVWIAELAGCGVTVLLPPGYTGLPIEVPPGMPEQWAEALRRRGWTVTAPEGCDDAPPEKPTET